MKIRPEVGEQAPRFVLPSAEGAEVSLEQRLGKALLISFLSHAA
ncbi:MAG TPA: hypothetical protein VGX68_28665 [Thermoanaerobaculia bacterium]|jgi:peroxiredoxin|nr:hypothetical protein [Thermoanaerobaculia bacterium]